GLARLRNRFVHDPAYTIGDDYFRLNITADRTIDIDMKPVDLPEMKKIEDQIVSLTMKFRRLMKLIYSELPSFDFSQFEKDQSIVIEPLPD
ncbi:MAG: hypothetical protein ACTSY1_01580, partial [Alphaproteobacteria bacterium]